MFNFYKHYKSASFHTVIHLCLISYHFILFSLFISFLYSMKKVKVNVSFNIVLTRHKARYAPPRASHSPFIPSPVHLSHFSLHHAPHGPAAARTLGAGIRELRFAQPLHSLSAPLALEAARTSPESYASRSSSVPSPAHLSSLRSRRTTPYRALELFEPRKLHFAQPVRHHSLSIILVRCCGKNLNKIGP